MRRGIILIAIIMMACTRQEVLTLCNTADPVKNLKWLEDFIAQVKADPRYQSVTISVMEYQGQTVFNISEIVQSCVYCDLRDCSGQKFMPADYVHFVANKKNEHKIWCQNLQFCVD